jgi:hypothetical protein
VIGCGKLWDHGGERRERGPFVLESVALPFAGPGRRRQVAYAADADARGDPLCSARDVAMGIRVVPERPDWAQVMAFERQSGRRSV